MDGVFSTLDFSGGKNDKVEDSLIKDNQAVDVQNCIAPAVGFLQQRPGQAYVNSSSLGSFPILGLHAYYYGSTPTRKLMVAYNGNVGYWTGSAVTNIKTGLNTTAIVRFVSAVNYLVAMNGIDAPWKWDGTTQSALANAPALGKCPVIHKDKLFCIVDNDTVNWSDSFAPESWPAVNYFIFGKGDGDQLVGIWPYQGMALFCKNLRFWNLKGSSLDDFESDLVESQHGVAGPRAGVVVDPYFYYISKDGIFRWDGLQSFDLTNPPDSSDLSGIPNHWANVNINALSGAVAGYNRKYNFVWFHVPEGASTTNNLVLAYDLKKRSWWPFRGIAASCMIDYNDGTTNHLYTGHATLGYIVEQNIGTIDPGSTQIASYWIGKNFDAGDQAHYKRIKKVFITDTSGQNQIVFSYSLDGGAFASPSVFSTTNNVRQFKVYQHCRKFQPQFSYTGQGFSLSGFESEYKVQRAR